MTKARNIADLGSNDVIETTATGVDVTGTVTADGLTVDGQGTFTTADNNAQVTLVSTDTDALVGPQLNLWRNSGTGTNGDLIGQITFTGEDTVGSTNTFASMYSVADQTNNGAEDGSLHFQTLINGVLEDRFEINDAGNSIFTGNVGLGTSSPSTKLMLEHSNDGAVGGTIRIKDRDSQQVPGQLTGAIEFESEDATMPTSGVSTAIKAYCASTAGGSYLTLSTTDQYTSTLDERVRITDSGRVGIGLTDPWSMIHVKTASRPYARFEDTDGTTQYIDVGTDSGNHFLFGYGSYPLLLGTNGTERARIDSSGNLLVGTTTQYGATGVTLQSDGLVYARRNNTPAYLRRDGGGGDLIYTEINGTFAGAIGYDDANGFYIDGEGGHTGIGFAAANWLPRDNRAYVDNVVDLGHPSFRFDDLHATNGTIQTSDRNEKQDIETLSDAEQRVAQACKGLLRKFRWKDSVAEKGDEARIHFGIIAQDLQDAFEAEGLDAKRYAMFISSTWTDEETGEERTRLGVRYPELLAFIIASI